MPILRGIRARLAVTLVALVALTAAILGVGSYLVVDSRLHDQFLSNAASQATFDLAELAPRFGLSASSTPVDVVASGIRDTLSRRGLVTIVDDGVVTETSPQDALPVLRAALGPSVDNGLLAYAWLSVDGTPSLVVGGRLGGTGTAIYFVHDATELENTLDQLRLALGGVALVLVVFALLVARIVARGVLAPIEAAGRAAGRIERGDLAARVPVTSTDEFGTWAERFNRMADALADTIGRLEAAQAQNRQFVADVAHELRTPLAALVAEASILRDHLDALPGDSRRAGELLVGDIARLRTLVEELMELSRFDAAAEQVASEPIDLGRLVRSVVAARLPQAELGVPADPILIETDPRRLERIIGNLLDNAREHGGGSTVDVTLETHRDALSLAVADRGPGVPNDRLDRIFERFYKADPSRHAGSSGLGLAIAAENAALLGGTLTAANRAEGGLRIELRLPVTGSLPRGDLAEIGSGDGGTDLPTAQEPTT
jgi:two-component system, OmpR family, sensor histidine kinase MtrB